MLECISPQRMKWGKKKKGDGQYSFRQKGRANTASAHSGKRGGPIQLQQIQAKGESQYSFSRFTQWANCFEGQLMKQFWAEQINL